MEVGSGSSSIHCKVLVAVCVDKVEPQCVATVIPASSPLWPRLLLQHALWSSWGMRGWGFAPVGAELAAT